MDESLRTLQRAVRAAPADRELRARLRAALLRQLPLDPAGAARGLDEVQGVLATPLSLGEQAGGRPAVWRRVSLLPGTAPLPPCAPAGEALQIAWEAPGVLRYLGADLALLEERDGGLVARAPADGRLLWRVEGGRALPAVEAWEDHEERAAWLGWAVAPWGAAALAAHWIAEVEHRRVGRWTPKGRTTERAPVGRGRTGVEVTLRALVGEGGRLGPGSPEELVERAGPGEALLETIELADWHDELLALSLDVHARQLAVRWRDEAEDWAVFLLLGDEHSRATLGPAGWSAPPPDDPFAPEGGGAAADPLPTGAPRLEEPALLPAEDGPLLAGRAGPRLEVWQLAPDGARRRWDGGPLDELVSGRKLRPDGPPAGEGEAALVVADGRLLLQLDAERVVALA